MIICERLHLEQRCAERGYALDEVAACIVDIVGEHIVVDETHPDYPREPRSGFLVAPKQHGPGAELKKLLAGWPFRIVATSNCSCNAKAAEMDRREQESPGWCEENLDTIVGWLREEASKRKLPFLDAAGRMLIRRAIRNARRAAS